MMADILVKNMRQVINRNFDDFTVVTVARKATCIYVALWLLKMFSGGW